LVNRTHPTALAIVPKPPAPVDAAENAAFPQANAQLRLLVILAPSPQAMATSPALITVDAAPKPVPTAPKKIGTLIPPERNPVPTPTTTPTGAAAPGLHFITQPRFLSFQASESFL